MTIEKMVARLQPLVKGMSNEVEVSYTNPEKQFLDELRKRMGMLSDEELRELEGEE
jgi:D-serine dehydratase